jgi:hypothetical protein
MNANLRTSQRGQAMSEFVAAMAVFLPLIMGVVYIGKYGDIKHQAIQASRYAAMERALDPQGHESASVVENETVARFFRDEGQHAIGLDDEATGATATDENPNWNQLGSGGAMLGSYSDVSVTVTSASNSTLLPMDKVAEAGFNRLSGNFSVAADVKVPLVNIASFAPLANINLTIEAKTVVAGDAWNGGGAADVGGRFTALSVPGRAISIIDKIPGVNTLFKWLSGTPAPQMGCVKPDVVPAADANGAKYNPSDDPTNPTSPNDKCYL